MGFKTPGREVANANEGAGKAEAGELPREVLVALGGKRKHCFFRRLYYSFTCTG